MIRLHVDAASRCNPGPLLAVQGPMEIHPYVIHEFGLTTALRRTVQTRYPDVVFVEEWVQLLDWTLTFQLLRRLFPCSYYFCAHLRLSWSRSSCSSRVALLSLLVLPPVSTYPLTHRDSNVLVLRLRAHPALCCLIAISLSCFPSPLPYPAVSLTHTSLVWSPPAFLHPISSLEPRAINRHPKHMCTYT